MLTQKQILRASGGQDDRLAPSFFLNRDRLPCHPERARGTRAKRRTCFYRTFPRAATFQLPSTRPRRPYQISSCRFTVAHTWLGTTQTFSPTRGGASSSGDSPLVPPLPKGEGVRG